MTPDELPREIEKLRDDAARLVQLLPNVLIRSLAVALVARLIGVLVVLSNRKGQ